MNNMQNESTRNRQSKKMERREDWEWGSIQANTKFGVKTKSGYWRKYLAETPVQHGEEGVTAWIATLIEPDKGDVYLSGDTLLVTRDDLELCFWLNQNPFKSEKQRRYMFANHPEIAKRWAHGK